MRQLNDFHCAACGATKEHFLDSNIDSVTCECGAESQKLTRAVRFKEKTTGKHVSGKALVRWGKKRERQLKHERKTSDE